jgi:hypothetical protein
MKIKLPLYKWQFPFHKKVSALSAGIRSLMVSVRKSIILVSSAQTICLWNWNNGSSREDPDAQFWNALLMNART